jgi:hypothetical protein
MVEQLPPTLTATVGRRDDVPDAGNMVDEAEGVAMRNVGTGAGDRRFSSDVERRGEHQTIIKNPIGKCDIDTYTIHQSTYNTHTTIAHTTLENNNAHTC